MTEIEETLFNETFRIMTDATNKGLSKSGAEVTPGFRQKLEQGNAVFSAFKVHRMQNDIAAQLYDSNGVLKPFEQWKNDVHPMLDHHIGHWLRTEYNTAVRLATLRAVCRHPAEPGVDAQHQRQSGSRP